MFPQAKSTYLIFGTVKNTGHIFHRTENSGCKWCLGGDMIVLISIRFENMIIDRDCLTTIFILNSEQQRFIELEILIHDFESYLRNFSFAYLDHWICYCRKGNLTHRRMAYANLPKLTLFFKFLLIQIFLSKQIMFTKNYKMS